MSKGGSPMGSGGFGGQQQQGGFGGGFGMPQRQQQRGFSGGFQPSRQGFGGGFGMPQQRQQQGFGNTLARTMPPPQQQGFGGGIGSFLGGQGFNMPQQMRDPMRPMVSRMAPEQDQPSTTPAPSTDMRAMMDPFRQQVNQMMQQRNMGGGSQPVVAQPGGNLLGGAFFGGGSQPVLGQPGGNLVGGMDPRVLRPNVNRLPSQPQPQTPPNPYAQQVRQEDPRMQAMRMMQRMRFGGGGGYNF